jgi:hypothetical protein
MSVAQAPASEPGLAAYREQADRFEAELLEEYYLHFAGLKEELAIEPVYERYENLTTLEAANRLGATIDRDRGAQELWRFACSGYLGNLAKRQEARLAELETSLEVTMDGVSIPYRMLRPTIANEPDRDRRRALEEARCALGEEHFNPVYLQTVALIRHGVRDLGADNYADLHRRFGMELDDLAAQCRTVLEETEHLFEDRLDRLFRERVGIPLDQARRWDSARLFRAAKWDGAFPAAQMLPALEATLDGLGIDLRAQPNVELDVEPREQKAPRAFCAPIEVPERVVLVTKPMGGSDDWRALFHEAGHTEHFANTAAGLPVESKRLGDNALTEGWAFLLEHLVRDPAWLTRRLDFSQPREFASEGAVVMLWAVRRHCAKLLYELELSRADDPRPLAQRYVELLADALKVEPSPNDWLADVDPGFYVTRYLRAWAFEAQLSHHLRERFGTAWFARRAAGSLLRELWSLGQGLTADELLADVTGSELQMASVTERLQEQLG